MLDFEKLPRFKSFSMPIVCKLSDWADAWEIEREEVERQIRIAHAWADNNPKKAPKSDILRYINNWLSIADRKGSLRRAPKVIQPRAPEVEPEMTYEEMVAIRKRNMGLTEDAG